MPKSRACPTAACPPVYEGKNCDQLQASNPAYTCPYLESDAIGYGFTFGSQTWLATWQSELSSDTFLDFRYGGYLGDNFRFATSQRSLHFKLRTLSKQITCNMTD